MQIKIQTLKTCRAVPTLIALAVLVVLRGDLSAPRPALAQTTDLKTAMIKWSGDGLKLELQAMPLDLVRAFFLGRGFTAKDAGFIARTGCIFRSAIGNSGLKATDPQITIKLANWQTISTAGKQSLRTREDWTKIWKNRQVSDNARTAFYWALFPTTQSYQSTDYNWGMISFALPPASRFDLKLSWRNGSVEKTKLLKNMECGK